MKLWVTKDKKDEEGLMCMHNGLRNTDPWKTWIYLNYVGPLTHNFSKPANITVLHWSEDGEISGCKNTDMEELQIWRNN